MNPLLPCGHPAAVVVHTADDGTQHCPACEAEARAAEPACPSCGVAYVDHLGLHGTCAEVQQLRAQARESEENFRAAEDLWHARGSAIQQLTATVDALREEADTLRAALTQARATNAALHRRTQAAERGALRAQQQALAVVEAAQVRVRKAENTAATVRRAQRWIVTRHAEVDAVAAALAEADALRPDALRWRAQEAGWYAAEGGHPRESGPQGDGPDATAWIDGWDWFHLEQRDARALAGVRR